MLSEVQLIMPYLDSIKGKGKEILSYPRKYSKYHLALFLCQHTHFSGTVELAFRP